MALTLFRKKPDLFDYEAERTCKNCGHAFQGKFCSRCGEKVVDRTDRSLRKLAESILNALTFLEGKFWRSFKLLFAHPGKLSSEIRAGIQVPYMRMVGLFFVANFFYFLFPVFDTFNSSLYSQFYQQDHSAWVQEMVRHHVKTHPVSVEEFTNAYNAHTANVSKLIVVVLVFLYTLPLSIINYSKKNLYFDHLQFSFEFHAYQLMVSSVVVPLVFKWLIQGVQGVFGWDWNVLLSDSFYSKVSLVLFGYFFIRGQRTYYGHGWIVSVLKGALLAHLVFYSWKAYRLILFFVTYWTM
ncbi:MAG: DUF3667 domain-containing protein [Cyclobacteriaceae bacterium]|jgi:hypothetical protein|nr:DUF3667 domain-containing protein [Cyclobacteriaceae bacterium]